MDNDKFSSQQYTVLNVVQIFFKSVPPTKCVQHLIRHPPNSVRTAWLNNLGARLQP